MAVPKAGFRLGTDIIVPGFALAKFNLTKFILTKFNLAKFNLAKFHHVQPK